MKLLRRPISPSDRIPDRFCVISMEFLSLSRRRSTSRNVPQRGRARRESSAVRRLLLGKMQVTRTKVIKHLLLEVSILKKPFMKAFDND